MAKDIIADFLVRLGFDGKEVLKGVAQTEAALKRLKKAKVDSVKVPRDVQLDQAVKKTRQRISAEQNLNRMKDKAGRDDLRLINAQKKAEIDKDKAFLRAAKDRLKEHKRMLGINNQMAKQREAQLKMTQRERHAEAVRLQQIRNSRRAVMRSANMRDPDALDAGTRGMLRSRLFGTRDKEAIKDINMEIREAAKSHREITRRMERQLTLANAMKFSFRGIVDSLKNMARSWVSIFAVLAGSVAGVRITQEFQALDASMLAVSENAEEAAKNVKFIKDLAKTLPIDLMKASDEFKNLLAAGREGIGTEGVQEVFKAFSEYGAALQIDPQRMSRAMVAVGQVFNKGSLMAEEVKNQIGENLSGALPIFAEALDMTTKEFFAAMERGELLANEVMPKVAEGFAAAARKNNALNKSLLTSRSQWAFLVTNFKLLFDGFGSGRLDRGLASFIRLLGKMLAVIKPLAQTLFYLLGVIFDIVGALGRGILTAFDPLLNIFKALEAPIRAVQDALSLTDQKLMSFLKDVGQIGVYFIPFLRWFAIIGDIVEEFLNIFTGHAQGILAGPGDTIGERLANGMIGKGFGAIITYLDNDFLPMVRSKAREWGEAIGVALADGIKNAIANASLLGWMFDPVNISEANARAQQRASQIPSIQTSMPGSGAPRVIINIDGKETMNREIDTRFNQEYKAAIE